MSYRELGNVLSRFTRRVKPLSPELEKEQKALDDLREQGERVVGLAIETEKKERIRNEEEASA